MLIKALSGHCEIFLNPFDSSRRYGGLDRRRSDDGMLVDRESLVDVGPEIESRTRHRRAAAGAPPAVTSSSQGQHGARH